jgi:hypothetical protein
MLSIDTHLLFFAFEGLGFERVWNPLATKS